MDGNKVAVLIEDMVSQFRVFGEGQQEIKKKVHDLDQEFEIKLRRVK